MSLLTQILVQGTVDIQSLRDIRPPVVVSPNLLPYYIGGVVVIGIIAVLAWYYLQKRRRAVSVSPTEKVPAPLPHEVAYQQLAAIEASDSLTRGDMEAYHTQVAYVLREYIRSRYQIPALALTTTALLHAMRHAQIGTLYVERVQQLLADCDRVKFASYRPPRSEAAARVAVARWIVDATKTSEM